jgi:ABC transporter with metal-binding/Fe-S-binding domain ATP-binding protein
MKLGILYSGGKDSTYAMLKAGRDHEIACLITVESENPESYMFHTPNISLTRSQADALGIPLVSQKTKGVKEDELKDLEKAIRKAKADHRIEGVVTGAIESVYQASRIERICNELGLWCFSPLWLQDQMRLLREIVENEFEVVISGVFAAPFDASWLGRKLDMKTSEELGRIAQEYKINPSGEGGEIETTVLDCPAFKKRLVITHAEKKYKNFSGVYDAKKVEAVPK